MSDDVKEQYIKLLKTTRPESVALIDQVITWINEEDIPHLTAFFARNNNSIPKELEINYWTLYDNQDALLKLRLSHGKEELKKYSINPDGSLNPQDIIFQLLYDLLPFDLQPRMQEALWKQYEKEWGSTWEGKKFENR